MTLKNAEILQASQGNCFKKAVNHIGASKYLWESPEMHQNRIS
jgi:hypothetical protein